MTSDLGPRTSDATRQVRVVVEAVAWVTRFVGGNGTRRQVFEETHPDGTTVRQALRGLSTRFPDLDQALWDGVRRDEVAEHIEVLINDAVLGVRHSLESPLADGDRITLVGAFMGG